MICERIIFDKIIKYFMIRNCIYDEKLFAMQDYFQSIKSLNCTICFVIATDEFGNKKSLSLAWNCPKKLHFIDYLFAGNSTLTTFTWHVHCQPLRYPSLIQLDIVEISFFFIFVAFNINPQRICLHFVLLFFLVVANSFIHPHWSHLCTRNN